MRGDVSDGWMFSAREVASGEEIWAVCKSVLRPKAIGEIGYRCTVCSRRHERGLLVYRDYSPM